MLMRYTDKHNTLPKSLKRSQLALAKATKDAQEKLGVARCPMYWEHLAPPVVEASRNRSAHKLRPNIIDEA